MFRRIQNSKRETIESTGRSQIDFPFHVGKGTTALATAFIVICVMIGAVQKKEAASVQTTQSDDVLSSETGVSPLPMTLEELLVEMGRRLGAANVVSKVRLQERTLRIMSDGPMFPLSKEKIIDQRKEQVDAVADTLAWAVNCHLNFTGDLASDEGQSALKECGLREPVRYECLPGKGRVDVVGIRFEGHADTVPFRKLAQGTVDSRKFTNNQDLSQARAVEFANEIIQCAKNKLGKLGSRTVIPHEAKGLSDTTPAETSGRDPKNRRVEIHFDETGSLPPQIR
jgi:hypothetical protein